jgi:hypothetical protein
MGIRTDADREPRSRFPIGIAEHTYKSRRGNALPSPALIQQRPRFNRGFSQK